jgi:hypothetical protein
MNSLNREPSNWLSQDRLYPAIATAAADPGVKSVLKILQVGPIIENILADIIFEWLLGFLSDEEKHHSTNQYLLGYFDAYRLGYCDQDREDYKKKRDELLAKIHSYDGEYDVLRAWNSLGWPLPSRGTTCDANDGTARLGKLILNIVAGLAFNAFAGAIVARAVVTTPILQKVLSVVLSCGMSLVFKRGISQKPETLRIIATIPELTTEVTMRGGRVDGSVAGYCNRLRRVDIEVLAAELRKQPAQLESLNLDIQPQEQQVDYPLRGAKLRSLEPGARINTHKRQSYAFCTKNYLNDLIDSTRSREQDGSKHGKVNKSAFSRMGRVLVSLEFDPYSGPYLSQVDNAAIPFQGHTQKARSYKLVCRGDKSEGNVEDQSKVKRRPVNQQRSQPIEHRPRSDWDECLVQEDSQSAQESGAQQPARHANTWEPHGYAWKRLLGLRESHDAEQSTIYQPPGDHNVQSPGPQRTQADGLGELEKHLGEVESNIQRDALRALSQDTTSYGAQPHPDYLGASQQGIIDQLESTNSDHYDIIPGRSDPNSGEAFTYRCAVSPNYTVDPSNPYVSPAAPGFAVEQDQQTHLRGFSPDPRIHGKVVDTGGNDDAPFSPDRGTCRRKLYREDEGQVLTG